MWLGDQDWVRCPTCDAWGWATITAVDALYTERQLTLVCAQGHSWQHCPDDVMSYHLRPPEPPALPPVYTVMRGPVPGRWATMLPVPNAEIGLKVLDRWQREHPRDWLALAVDDGIVVTAVPWSLREQGGRASATHPTTR